MSPPLQSEEQGRRHFALQLIPSVRRQSNRHCQSEGSVFDTVRTHVLTHYPPVAELVRERFPADPAGEAAFSYALELYLRALPNLDVAVDGWSTFRVVRESRTSLRAVGIMYVLPASELPVEVELSREFGSTRYRVRVGIEDARWSSLSESKRWKVVYLYATGERDEEWNWSEPVEGCVADA